MTLSVRELVLDNSRADILQAAANCFTERGYAQTSIDDVARRLSATKGRIYHHYPSKADLFADVFKTGMDMNYAAVAPYRDMPGSPIERWRRMATAHVRQMVETVHVLYRGEIVESGPADDVLDHPRHWYTAKLLSSVPGAA